MGRVLHVDVAEVSGDEPRNGKSRVGYDEVVECAHGEPFGARVGVFLVGFGKGGHEAREKDGHVFLRGDVEPLRHDGENDADCAERETADSRPFLGVHGQALGETAEFAIGYFG